ncbi:APC family permease [Longirhabdus pacifica]|uniref:APC family permease n=1 Tax=Longirhabdus pacifica TaxID=2305227 RepID=UPI0013E8EC3D|nr:amino acid permease [Longirhabdus pacifica]
MNTVKEKKLNAIQLSGLIIGPILGSGIIILPPLIYEVAGEYAILSWVIIMIVNCFFAYLFGQLSMKFPGDAGVTQAIEAVFGKQIRMLASFFIIGAVCFGPIAVLLTAAQFLPNPFLSTEWTAFVLMGLSLVILLRHVSFVGQLSFILSSISVILLFSGGLVSLVLEPKLVSMNTSFDLSSFGSSLLLLFWMVVGWEVIGNYSNEVKNTRKTIPRAITFSTITITVVCLIVAAAIQWSDIQGEYITVTAVLKPLFGSAANVIMGIVAPSLCLTGVILFIGGIARLIHSTGVENKWPKIFTYKTANAVPITGIIMLFTVHMFVFIFIFFDVLHVQQLVAIADAFFISNVLVCLLAAWKLFPSKKVKIMITIMCIVLFGILLFSSPYVLIVIVLLMCFFITKQVKENKQAALHLDQPVYSKR